MPDPLPPVVPLLRQRNFAALWWGQLISILGERLTYLALDGLLAKHTTYFRDPRVSSLLLTVLFLVTLAPVLLFAPFTGAWVDRWNLKRVMVGSDLLRSGLVVLIPVAYLATAHTLPVFVLVFALFTCNVFFLPAKSALTPELVPPEQLLPANALLSGAGIVATAAGMLGGGWIIDHWGWSRALYLNGATYLVSVIALLIIRYRPAPHLHRAADPTVRSYLAEVAEGWSIVRRNPAVGLALTAMAAVWVGGGLLHVAGNQHVQRAAGIPGMLRVGVLVSTLGFGSALTTWWLNKGGRRVPRPLLFGGGLLIAAAGILAFAVSTRFAIFTVAAFLIGIGAAPAFMLPDTLIQESTEMRQRGRVFSARDFLMRLVALVGAGAAWWATRALGIVSALLLCAGAVACAGLLSLAWGRRVPKLMRTGGPEDLPRSPRP